MNTKRKAILILALIIGIFAFAQYHKHQSQKKSDRLKEIEDSRHDKYVESMLEKVREWNLSAEELMERRDSLSKSQKDLSNACCYVAAEKGNPEAVFAAGVMAQDGVFVRKNLRKAIEWYEKSAKQGNSDAMFNLGYIYSHEDDGFKPDYKKALEYYRMAAANGDKDALSNIALMYIEGKGVKDPEKGLEILKKLADGGDRDAAFNIALMYYEGKGVKKNLKSAFEWMMKAANAGSAQAQYNIGVMYENGEGVGRNDNMARYWFAKAALNGSVAGERALMDE